MCVFLHKFFFLFLFPMFLSSSRSESSDRKIQSTSRLRYSFQISFSIWIYLMLMNFLALGVHFNYFKHCQPALRESYFTHISPLFQHRFLPWFHLIVLLLCFNFPNKHAFKSGVNRQKSCWSRHFPKAPTEFQVTKWTKTSNIWGITTISVILMRNKF